MTAPTSTHRPARTSLTAASSRGTGRTSRAACHVDASPSRPPEGRRVSSNATSTTTKSTGSTYAGSRQCQITDCSTIPSTTAASAMVGNRSMRPITAAARARNRIAGPSTSPRGKPTMPARKYTARNAKTVASTHTTVWRRRTGMPSVAARSARSAPPRIAMPMSLNRRKSPSAANRSGIATIATMSAPRKMIGSIVKCASNGAGIGPPCQREPARQQERSRCEQLRDADGRDGEDQARRAEEAPDEERLDDEAEHNGDHEPRRRARATS